MTSDSFASRSASNHSNTNFTAIPATTHRGRLLWLEALEMSSGRPSAMVRRRLTDLYWPNFTCFCSLLHTISFIIDQDAILTFHI
jgi:hypothetical protein